MPYVSILAAVPDARHGKPQQLGAAREIEFLEVRLAGRSYSSTLLFVFSLLRQNESLFDAGGVAKKHRLRIDCDDGVAAGDRVAFANEINLTVAGENRGALAAFLRDAGKFQRGAGGAA